MAAEAELEGGATMQCPNCHAEISEGAAFCGACGAPIEQPVTDPAATQPIPQPDAAAEEAYAQQQAEYERKKAEYDRQKAAYDQQQYAQQQAAYQQQYAPAQPQAPKKSKAGCFIALAIVLILLLVGCGVGGYFAYRAWQDGLDDVIPAIDGSATDDTGEATDGSGFDTFGTADEAVAAQLEASGFGDWVYEVVDEGDGWATYWAGPPNSEYVDELYLEQDADGMWYVLSAYSISDTGATDAQSEAMMTVYDYLTAVYEDRGTDAQTYTVEPFSNDAASAQVSAGGLTYYEVPSAEDQGDGTYWVRSVETWYGENQSWDYYVVPTDAGYRISDIRYVE